MIRLVADKPMALRNVCKMGTACRFRQRHASFSCALCFAACQKQSNDQYSCLGHAKVHAQELLHT